MKRKKKEGVEKEKREQTVARRLPRREAAKSE
jgi:hypothetical protein